MDNAGKAPHCKLSTLLLKYANSNEISLCYTNCLFSCPKLLSFTFYKASFAYFNERHFQIYGTLFIYRLDGMMTGLQDISSNFIDMSNAY